jgi:hypothetical protein
MARMNMMNEGAIIMPSSEIHVQLERANPLWECSHPFQHKPMSGKQIRQSTENQKGRKTVKTWRAGQ